MTIGKWRCVAIVVGLTALLAACAPSPPRVTRVPMYPLELGPIFLTLKNVDHEVAIKEALTASGIPLAEGPDDVMYTLRVHFGASKGSSPECGKLRNVKYLLDFAPDPHQMPLKRSQLKAMRISARGYDGDCHPNVFDDMAVLLRENMLPRSRKALSD